MGAFGMFIYTVPVKAYPTPYDQIFTKRSQ